MATKWLSDQVNLILHIQGQAIAGLGGAPSVPRVEEYRGILKVIRFTIEQATPNEMPGNVGDTLATGDSFIIALLNPTDRLYAGRIIANAWGGTTVTIEAGKYDPNTATLTADRYLAAAGITTAGIIDFDLNLTEQVGADPAGDNSVGNSIPNFGSQKVQIVLTLGGTLGTSGTLIGFLSIIEEGN